MYQMAEAISFTISPLELTHKSVILKFILSQQALTALLLKKFHDLTKNR